MGKDGKHACREGLQGKVAIEEKLAWVGDMREVGVNLLIVS